MLPSSHGSGSPRLLLKKGCRTNVGTEKGDPNLGNYPYEPFGGRGLLVRKEALFLDPYQVPLVGIEAP